jgi:hypothetical protein
MINYILIFSLLILGLYFIYKRNKIEQFENKPKCPNVLLERENRYYLYNSDLAIVPGVNPISFNNLEEYTEFLEWQRGQGIDCPVLKLQKSFDTQNNEIYQVTSNVFSNDNLKLNYDEQNTKSIHNATMDNPRFNQGRMSFDPTNQQIGRYTGLDQMYHDNTFDDGCSANPMDTNWCGPEYTRKKVKEGVYKEDAVYKKSS